VPAQSKIRALLVDDEDLARHVLRELLKSHPEVEIAGECANGFEAVKAVAEQRPNLIFLNVQMPKLTGFDVLELIGTEIPVVFVTAYDQHAMRAFEVHAVDYLLKPVSRERLEAALDPARFVRIHRSYIVNFARVARIEPYGKDSRLAILTDGTRLPVSRAGYARLKSLLDDRA
jgi:two-component system LytT family response regulator